VATLHSRYELALKACTAIIFGAELMQTQNDIGTVEAGKYADIFAVQGNPLSDISLMQKIIFRHERRRGFQKIAVRAPRSAT